jgi:hypothetical protein
MRLALCAVLAVGFGLAACGQSDTTISAPGGTVSTSSDGSTTTVTGTNGEQAQFGNGSAAVAQLPDFLPIYPGAKVTTGLTGTNTTTKTGSIAFETSAAVADVIAFYKEKATAQGLPETLSSTDSGVATFMAVKDQVVIQIIASKGVNATEAQLTWALPLAK